MRAQCLWCNCFLCLSVGVEKSTIRVIALSIFRGVDMSYLLSVHTFFSGKPTISINCPSINKINEGDDFSCECGGEGGNPPANVIWYKDEEKIGEIGIEKQTLTLSKVNITANGAYKCVANSHSLKNQKSIKLIVYCK